MSRFIKNVLKLLSAAMIGQIIGFLVIPILSRLYSPMDFGIYELFVSFVIIIGSIACFSYHNAIFLPKDEEGAATLAFLCFILIILTSIVSTITLFLLKDWIAVFFDTRQLSNFFVFIPLAILFYSLAYMLANWSSRRQKFTSIAVANASSSISNKIFSLIVGVLQPSPIGLVGGSMTNDGVQSLIMLHGLRRELRYWRDVSWKKMKELAIRYRNFPLFMFPSSLANDISYYITPFFLSYYFGPAVVGLYSLASMVTKIPSRLAGNAIYQVFFQSAADERRVTGKVTNTVREVYKRLISFGLFPVALILIGGEDLFRFFLGQAWYDAGIYAKILILYTFVTFISLPLNSIFSVLEKQKIGFIFNFLLLVSRVSSLMIGGWTGDIILTLLFYSMTGFFFWSWKNLYILHLAEIGMDEVTKDTVKALALLFLFVLPVAILKLFFFSELVFIIVCILMAIVYYYYHLIHDERLNAFLKDIINSVKGI